MLILFGKRKKLAKVTSWAFQNIAIAQMEMPPGSGMIYMPLIENGRNVEEWKEEKQLSML